MVNEIHPFDISWFSYDGVCIQPVLEPGIHSHLVINTSRENQAQWDFTDRGGHNNTLLCIIVKVNAFIKAPGDSSANPFLPFLYYY